MTPRETREAIKQAIENLRRERAPESMRIMFEVKALIQDRVNSSGEDAEGSRFLSYTQSYEKQKANEGYQVAHPDFTKTGEGFIKIEPIVEAENDTSVTISLEAADELTNYKLTNWSRERNDGKQRKPLLRINEEETEFIIEAHIQRIQKALAPIL